MEGTAISAFLSPWLDLIIDVGLMTAFFFLWLSWYRNGSRQKKLEQLLAETARQLEEATLHLSQATQSIEHLKRQKQRSTNSKPEKSVCATPTLPAKLPPQQSTQATMILRMKREGESPQTIAERLDMPLAQVNLLLKLHAASSPVD